MSNKTSNQSHIEIRSEKVRNIIGTNPPKFISLGIVIIILVFFVFFAFVLNLPFPYGSGETIFQHFFLTQL